MRLFYNCIVLNSVLFQEMSLDLFCDNDNGNIKALVDSNSFPY